MKFINSWKNKKVFEKQLSLNLKELSGTYPSHWNAFLVFIGYLEKTPAKRIIDVGCGCGSYSELCRRHAPWLRYTGIDYAQEAVDVASKQWFNATFFQKDYKDLTRSDFEQIDILHACSLHNVLPDGDTCMEFLLSLRPKYAIFGKIYTTIDKSHYTVYKAYDEINAYLFKHNGYWLRDLFKNNGYIIKEIKDGEASNFFLTRNDYV